MPVQPTYPGVYVEEIPSGVRPVPTVSTSATAFVGTFRKGLLNEAVQIFNMGDFEREYGGLDRFSETSYAIQQFFLNGGTEAWAVRVADTVTGAGAVPPTNARSATVVLTSQPAGGGDEIFHATAGRRVRGESAENPGEWGNLVRLDVDFDTANPVEQFNLTVSEVRIDGDRTVVLRTEVHRNLTMRPDTPNNALEVVNQASGLVQLDRGGLNPANLPVPFVPTFRPASNGTLGNTLPVTGGGAPLAIPADGAALNVDIGAGAINGTIQYNGPVPTSYGALRPFIEQAVRRASADPSVPNGLKPLLSGAMVKLIGADTNASPLRFFVQLGRSARPYDPATIVRFTGAAAGAAPNGVRLAAATNAVANVQQDPLGQTAAERGHDGQPPAPGTTFRPVPVGFFQGQQAAKTGLYALEDVDIFNILSIPEATTLAPAAMRTLYAEAEAYVEDRRSMLIVDIPETVLTLNHMQAWLMDNEGLRHPNGAVYFPRTNIADPLNRNRPRSIASSGTIAGLWARTDTARGVWKAPAGTEAGLRNVESLGYLLTDQENGQLNPLGVNCLRNFPIYSNICWGARTLHGADALASDWKYVPVRRTTLFIEESLFRGTKWVVFEPNDEPLWAQVRLNVGTFMQDLFRKGAFQGSTPREAYFVKCDSETTTQSDIDNGIVNIEVGFAPLKPAEFVILKIQHIVRRPEA